MTNQHDDETSVVPVFPLPNAVLFPQTILPLHVFEPRYREMVRDAVAADGQLVIALLEPGFEKDYDGAPPIHAVGTLGRIEELSPQEDGRFIFHLVGVERVDLEEVPSDKPYRMVRATLRPELSVDEADPELGRSKLELLASHGMLMRELGEDAAASLVIDDALAFDCAVNGTCANLPAAAEVRQQLLELDDPRERQQHALLLVNRALHEVLERKAAQGDLSAADLN